MGFRKSDGSNFTQIGSVSTTDRLLVESGSVVYETPIAALPFLSLSSAEDYITSASASAVIRSIVVDVTSAAGYISSASAVTIINAAVSNQISAGGFITSVSAESLFTTSAEVCALLEPYITSAEVCTLLEPYITSAEVCTLLEPYITSAEVCTLLGPYATSTAVSATYLTKTSAAEFVTSGSVSAFVAGFGYITSGSASALALAVVRANNFVSITNPTFQNTLMQLNGTNQAELLLLDATGATFSLLNNSSIFDIVDNTAAADTLVRIHRNAQQFTLSAGGAALEGEPLLTSASITVAVCALLEPYITSAEVCTLLEPYITSAESSVVALSAIRRHAVYRLSTITETTVNSGTAETSLMKFDIPAGLFTANGQMVRLTSWGNTANNTNTKTVKIYINSSAVLANGNMATNLVNEWVTEVFVTRTSSNLIKWFYSLERDSAGVTDIVLRDMGETSASADTVISVLYTATGSVTSDISQHMLLVEFLP